MIPGATAPHVAVHFCATKQSTTMAATSVAHAAPRAAVRASVAQPGRCHAAMRERRPCAVPEFTMQPVDRLLLSVRGAAVGGHRVAVKRRLWSPALWLVRTTAFILSICQPFCLASWPAAWAHDLEPCCSMSWCVGDWTATAWVPSSFLAESQDWSLLASMMLICPGRRVRNLTFELPLTSGPVDPLASLGFRSVQPDSLVRFSPTRSSRFNHVFPAVTIARLIKRVSHTRSKSIKRCISVKTPSKCVLFHMQIDTLCACSLVYRPLIT